MRRAAFVMLILGAPVAVCASACASGGPPPPNDAPRGATIVTSSETGVMVADRPAGSSTSIAAPPARVWAAMKATLADLDVPVTVENPATHQIGNPAFIRSREFAGTAMSRLVDCGEGAMGPKAASYRITMSLLAFVTANAAGGTDVLITFVPSGEDVTSGSGDHIVCGSTGRLEQLVLAQLQAKLAAP